MKSKELRAQRAKLIDEARTLITGENVGAEESARFDAMMADAEKLKGQIDRIESAEALAAQNEESMRAQADRRNVDVDEVRDEKKLQNEAFMAYMRGGLGSLSAAHRKVADARFQAAQSTGTGTAGGYTIPEGFYQQLIDAQKAYGGMLGVANIFDTTTGNPMTIPTDNDTTNAGAILTENTTVSAQDVVFGQVGLGAYTYTSKLVLVSNQLLQDSAFDLGAFLNQKLATRIARIVNTHFTVGTGTDQPDGVVTSAALGATGAAGETASLITDDLIELEHSVDPAYRTNARFMFADSTLKVIKKLKDSQGRPLWLPGIAVREPDTINGYAYTINQDMPAMAAGAKSIAFGDFSSYMIRRVAGVQVLRLSERYADANQTGFVAFQRWDGTLVDAGTHPVKYFANAAE